MDEHLALSAGDADRAVLDRAAEAAHRVALEVRERDHGVVARQVGAHEVLDEVRAALDGQAHRAVGVHNVHVSDGSKAVIGGGPEVTLRGSARPSVGGVALHDSGAEAAHEIADEVEREEVVPARLAGRELHGHVSGGREAQGVEGAGEALRRDFTREVDGRSRGRRDGRGLRLLQRGLRHSCLWHVLRGVTAREYRPRRGRSQRIHERPSRQHVLLRPSQARRTASLRFFSPAWASP